MPTESTLPPEGERRSHVRVNDAIGLRVQRLEELPAAGDVPNSSAEVVSSGAAGTESRGVRRPNKYAIEGYAEVRRHYPQVAGYINELEERIRELLLDGETAAPVPTHKVSLSASGLRFADNLLLHPGELVGLTLTLFPSGQRIGRDARVIAANDSPEVASGDQLSYRLSFVRMSDADRDALDQHVNDLLQTRARLDD